MIELAENVLRDAGFYDVRVRHHELPSSQNQFIGDQMVKPTSGIRHLARIEVGASELPKLLANGLSAKIADALKQIGYAHVTVDLAGYRRGSANEILPGPKLRHPA
jgi:uncharacterized protein